ncbi:hypothetical protein FB451DRAFT_1182692 [Mycena latifolia]|nr:hypothetical protein FB451DRAFT_1182692 [Mycena latifolia]
MSCHIPPNRGVDSSTPRLRASVACVRCRKRKIKCISSEGSPDRPCERCARRGFVCKYLSVGEERAQSSSNWPAGVPAYTSSPTPSTPQPAPPTTPAWSQLHHSFDQFNNQELTQFEYRPYPPMDRSYFPASTLSGHQPSAQWDFHTNAANDVYSYAQMLAPPPLIQSTSQSPTTRLEYLLPFNPGPQGYRFSNLSTGFEHPPENLLIQPNPRPHRHAAARDRTTCKWLRIQFYSKLMPERRRTRRLATTDRRWFFLSKTLQGFPGALSMAFLDELYDYFARGVKSHQTNSFPHGAIQYAHPNCLLDVGTTTSGIQLAPPNPYCSTNLESCMLIEWIHRATPCVPIESADPAEVMWAAEPAADRIIMSAASSVLSPGDCQLSIGAYGAGSRQAPVQYRRPFPASMAAIWSQKLFFHTRNCFIPASASHEHRIDLDWPSFYCRTVHKSLRLNTDLETYPGPAPAGFDFPMQRWRSDTDRAGTVAARFISWCSGDRVRRVATH